MKAKNKPVHGIGVNDADYPVNRYVNKRRVWSCPIYRAWSNMLNRCYSASYQQRYPTYKQCTVAPEWLLFSGFASWVSAQGGITGRHVDKDILIPGNTLYSPDRCVLVDAPVNIFLIDSGASRGELPIGVHWVERDKKFQASCRNPFTDKQENLGLYGDPDSAHAAWRTRKHQHACRYADMQSDPRIAQALRTRYLPGKEAS